MFDKQVNLIQYQDLNQDHRKEILRIRNLEEIRRWMYNQSIISSAEHEEFIRGLVDAKDKLYFAVIQNNVVLGSLYFFDFSPRDSSAFFGLFSNPNSSQAGMGRILEELAIEYAFRELKVKQLCLDVFKNNKVVINLHKKYGFEEIDSLTISGFEILRMQKDLA